MEKKRFTVIDFLIILVVLIAAVVVAKVLTPEKTETNGQVEFVVLASGLQKEVADLIQKDEEIVISHTQKNTETITNVEVKPAELVAFDGDSGEYKTEESKLTKDVYITIKADAEITDEKIEADDVAIRVGSYISISGKEFATGGHIIKILSETQNN